MVTHLYRVAGLVFSLQLPEGHPLLGRLQNYLPFEIPGPAGDDATEFAGPTGELLFSLSLSDTPPEGPFEPVYLPKAEAGEPVVNLYRCAGGWMTEFAPVAGVPVCGRLVFDTDYRQGRLFAEGNLSAREFAVNNALMLLFAFASARFDALEMHASVVTRGGRGFLFLGRSGTGKSTHSSLWLKHIEGTSLLNDDNPVLRIVDGVARVFGTPWSGKTPCYKAEDAPVGAIVRLRQAPANEIVRLGVPQAYASVMSSCSGFRPIRQLADAQHATLAAIATGVPCYQLDCLPDEAAARLCQSTVDG